MFGLEWLICMWKDEIGLAQARIEADKIAKKFMAEANNYCTECKFDDGILIDCPFASQWLKTPCDQCPRNKEHKMKPPAIKVDRATLTHLQLQCRVQTSNKYLFTELCDFVLDEDKEHKMTREEAYRKVEANIFHTKEAVKVVNALEALGLLKFDEPVKKPSAEKGKYIFFPNPDGPNKINVSVLQSDAIETMERYGYKVEPKPSKPIEPSPVEKGLTQVIGTYAYAKIKHWLTDHGYMIVENSRLVNIDPQFVADAKEPNEKLIWIYNVPENIRIEKRSTGFVLWVDGKIQYRWPWRSWEPNA